MVAQEKDTAKFKRFSIEPHFGFYNLPEITGEHVVKSRKHSIPTFGGYISYHFSPRLNLFLGFDQSRFEYSYVYDDIVPVYKYRASGFDFSGTNIFIGTGYRAISYNKFSLTGNGGFKILRAPLKMGRSTFFSDFFEPFSVSRLPLFGEVSARYELLNNLGIVLNGSISGHGITGTGDYGEIYSRGILYNWKLGLNMRI